MSDPAPVHLSRTDLEARVAAAFTAANTAPDIARTVAAALVHAEIDGKGGHGLSRVASYTGQSRSGKVDGHARPTLEHRRPGSLLVDAAHGFAYPALELALDALPPAAKACGIAAAAITRSHHMGVAGHPVERLADQGFVALAFANTPGAIAPWGGRRAVFGTNPIAFAAPLPGRPAAVVDLALSEVARGNLLKAQQAGTPIAEGWALDADGQPTTDPAAGLAGTMVPLGGAATGAKGAALAFMVEVLAAAIAGAALAGEASSFFAADGAPPGVGQLLIAIDPGGFAGADAFAERISTLAADIEGQEGTRLPGAGRMARRAAAERDGVSVPAARLAEIDAIANEKAPAQPHGGS